MAEACLLYVLTYRQALTTAVTVFGVGADSLCDPADTGQTFVEELVHLPHCFLCYTPATGQMLHA